ncbi:MAG: bifunctional 4-hydroxy-2-oxoglutarate aldolase/2-dehydro-3-deoxy-phosphogluconate aldolase [Bacteroides sp.]|nr:bifunctional 4-hydroxy-2-oxoglutarate aldolase/2-dehydro-3-deoxy-phosphogluconate aldolase [Prevotella sp.]MCM1407467.1 bifunctional 4-hydroxy-2-oxoglutarate aldolase/2-dehydro-3-deoxy-phosphogluconate aldolase [Treponema brennaborense]MCM1469957.1 bifunctional 4-hydroxy-2-oxoglutarate aldolase/2-dehydro-3-deoxy-phosphogluconate aldolase [Bacteroides sp.]
MSQLTELETKMRNIGIIPVVVINDAAKAVPLAKALIAGGIPAAEVTFRTAAAADAIRKISKECPDMLVGAGTVINVDLAEKAIAAGSKFIVSPGFNPAVVQYCIDKKIPVIPGVSSASQIEQGLSMGLTTLKFFPAEQEGGAAKLSALGGPFPQVMFMPTGGVNAKNVGDYAKLKNVLACGGSWMVKADLIEKEDWNGITALCKEAMTAIHGFSFAHVGINQENETEAQETSALLALFGFAKKEGNGSIFNSTEFEVMKHPFRGTKGHIGIKTFNVDRAAAYLKQFGFNPVMETAKYLGEEGNSPLKVVYLDKEIGGFAVHLVKA